MNAEMRSLQPAPRPRTILIWRHSAVTRLTHWLNVLCLSFLLLSGLQIFNAYPGETEVACAFRKRICRPDN